jgi:replicative DNA helicase Mcm
MNEDTLQKEQEYIYQTFWDFVNCNFENSYGIGGEFSKFEGRGELYRQKIADSISTGKKYVDIDFKDLILFDGEFAQKVLEDTKRYISLINATIRSGIVDFFPEQYKLDKDFTVRLHGLTDYDEYVKKRGSRHIYVREIDESWISKFVQIDGVILQATNIDTAAKDILYSCRSCSWVRETMFMQKKNPKCYKCKTHMVIESKKLYNSQILVIEDLPESEDRNMYNPRSFHIKLTHDICNEIWKPGSRVRVTGMVTTMKKEKKHELDSDYQAYLDVSWIRFLEDKEEGDNITEQEEKKILELSKDSELKKKLIEVICPNIYGLQEIKESILLQLIGGVSVNNLNRFKRGDIHILLWGDASTGKSTIQNSVLQLHPRSMMVTGKGVSKAGLTASVSRDELLGKWFVQAGALPLTNRGILCIDEIDKMSEEDRTALHEAMEKQTVTINKAGIHATLPCQTKILAAGNPKSGRMSRFELPADQIELPPTLLSRFDLIFVLYDTYEEEAEEEKIRYSLDDDAVDYDSLLSRKLARKYILYSKGIDPKMTPEVRNYISKYFHDLRKQSSNARTVPITHRQLEGIRRLTEAHARLRLSKIIEVSDAEAAIKLMTHSLGQVAVDIETGEMDVGAIVGKPASRMDLWSTVRKAIETLSDKKDVPVDIDKVIQIVADKSGKETYKIEMEIERMKREGILFEPRRGKLKVLK